MFELVRDFFKNTFRSYLLSLQALDAEACTFIALFVLIDPIAQTIRAVVQVLQSLVLDLFLALVLADLSHEFIDGFLSSS